MKSNIVFIISILISSFNLSFATVPSYVEGQTLNVFAPSGLKLRAFPNRAAEVVEIVEFGDQVKVLNTFDFIPEKAERIDWIDGHWIFVEFGGASGYLFDGYLSSMPFPSDRDEMISDGYSYAYTLGQYMEQHYEITHLLDSSETSLSYILEDGSTVNQKIDSDYWIIEIETPSYKIHEVLNLMRSMVPDRKSRSAFERSLLFIEDDKGRIGEIKVKLGDEAILRRMKNGNILIKASGYVGC